jgi:lysophospholipase L1-like esterase
MAFSAIACTLAVVAAWNCRLDLLDRISPVVARIAPLEQFHLSRRDYLNRRKSLRPLLREVRTVDLVMIGDSHVEYLDAKKHFPGLDVVNLGVRGDTTVGVCSLLSGDLSGLTAKQVLLAVGYNDLKFRSPVETARGVAELLGVIRSIWPGARIFLQGTFPVRADRATMNAKLIELNRKLGETCQGDLRCVFADVAPYLRDQSGGLAHQLSRDGLHLNDAGNAVWAEILRTFIEKEKLL